jgi:hypothetical protein
MIRDWREKMPSAIFKTMKLLEDAHIWFRLERTRPDALTIIATIVGERIEIEIFEDDHLEISRFRGDESVEGGMALLLKIVKAELQENYHRGLPEPVAD